MKPEQEMKASRDGYGDALQELGRKRKDIVALDADLAESTKSGKFGKEFPERFFDMGISEQELIGTAAGLASCGKTPFASSFAVFITGISYNVIRSLVCYPSLNVKITGSHGGILTGEDGATHQGTEDVGLMRGMPNMKVIVAADYTEAKKAVFEMAETKGPVYLRTARSKTPVFFGEDYRFRFGKATELRKGNDVAVFANGPLVAEALKAAEALAGEGIECSVINMSSVKPLDERMVLKKASECRAIVTAEDHSVVHGMGSAVQEALSSGMCCLPVEKVGVKDVFGESGKPYELYRKYGLDSSAVVRAAKKALERCKK
jgi:transketolase